jgi:hypothetical protein
MNTPEILVPEPRCLKMEIAIEELKIYKSPATDKIPAELIQDKKILPIFKEDDKTYWMSLL